ncbi:heat-inducible transcriptional repressor HrcA [Candidatus Kapabacteria bacterium]|nr:heat-inducible transcriptional repressor HrcA [Candidatus Kapabacteria bacterium]
MLHNLKSTNNLSLREQDILRSIVNLYILKAVPVGSRKLSKYLEGQLELSAATLRNIMSDLEEMDYINHPHTSAGRVPTDKGYRFYVDSLTEIENLSSQELEFVKKLSESELSGNVLKQAGSILALLSQSIGLVRIPHLQNLIVEKVHLINIASNRILVVLALDSNIIRHVSLESELEVDIKDLDNITHYINERLSGKRLSFIQDNFNEMMSDIASDYKPLLRLFVDSVDKIFHLHKEDRIITTGTQNLLKYPEFEDLKKVQSIIELVENKDLVIHLLDSNNDSNTKVLIGSESGNEAFNDYSVVLSNYSVGSATGSIGLIGPKRMNYSKMLTLVKSVSNILGSE